MTDLGRGAHLPHGYLTRWLVDPGRALPASIRAQLFNSLYGSLPIFLGGVLNTLAVSTVIALRHPEPLFIFWAALELLLACVRVPVLIEGRRAVREGRQGPSDLYIILACMWAACVGYGCLISVLSGDWVSVSLAFLSAAAMVGGICLRNFSAPRLAAVRSLAAVAVITALLVLAMPSLTAMARGTALLTNGPPSTLPAYVDAAGRENPDVGTIIMTPQNEGGVSSRVVWGGSETLNGQATMISTRSTASDADQEVATLTANLVTSAAEDAIGELAADGISFILLAPAAAWAQPAPVPPTLRCSGRSPGRSRRWRCATARVGAG